MTHSNKRSYYDFVVHHGSITSVVYPDLDRILDELPNHASVLDAGCGTGVILQRIHRRRPDLRLFGVDIGDVAETLPEYVTFRRDNALSVGFSELFDLIISFNVLEHVREPLIYFEYWKSILNQNGGQLFVRVPHYNTIFIKNGKDPRNFFADYTHIMPYSEHSLFRLFYDAGYNAIQVVSKPEYKFFNRPYYSLIKHILRIVVRRTKFSEICKPLDRIGVHGWGRVN